MPDAPDAPTVSDITATSCTVQWTAPANDGGSPVTGYYIERQSNVTMRWVRINRAPVTDVTHQVDDLNEGSEYIFRIVAENKKGESQPSLPSDTVKAKNPYGMCTTA